MTNRDTLETLLCIAYVFEVSTSEHGAQHHIYRLVKDWHSHTIGTYLFLTHCSTSVSNNTKQWTTSSVSLKLKPYNSVRSPEKHLFYQHAQEHNYCWGGGGFGIVEAEKAFYVKVRKKKRRRGPWYTVVSIPKEPNLANKTCMRKLSLVVFFYLILLVLVFDLVSFTHMHVQGDVCYRGVWLPQGAT